MIGTILAAPIIFASIQMIHVKTGIMVEHFTKIIDKVCKDVSILSVICLVSHDPISFQFSDVLGGIERDQRHELG